MKTCLMTLGVMLGISGALVAQEESTRLEGDELKKALNDRADDLWIYDDLKKAYAEGEQSGKPVLVSFRCVP